MFNRTIVGAAIPVQHASLRAPIIPWRGSGARWTAFTLYPARTDLTRHPWTSKEGCRDFTVHMTAIGARRIRD